MFTCCGRPAAASFCDPFAYIAALCARNDRKNLLAGGRPRDGAHESDWLLNQCPDTVFLRWNARNHTQVPVAMKLSHFRHPLDALGIETAQLRSHGQLHRRGSKVAPVVGAA
jgi:hypothetical protein